MEVIPAIDLRGGRCVRLFQGDYSQETAFSDDPAAVARGWQEQGAKRLHVVDLDGAATGIVVHKDVIGSILQAVTIPVQVGGGLRHQNTVEEVLRLGVDRAVLGTAAIEQPALVQELCHEHPEAIVVAVDARAGQVALRGWKQVSAFRVGELLPQLEAWGVRRLLYTDVSRDGTLTEPNFEAVSSVVASTHLRLLVAGGIASVDHLKRLSSLGVEGAIVGMALYTGRMDLKEALRALAERGP
ncbi:MAG: 1-(5-phosphoribosyl)-5-[(5-phosphoribosylamino)methylideneamino]imidazole-4-carboxamide isomerase [Chloroflexi bacterium]|nr:1-(5-phosphoribosyl)-5-[(5-phosphoribosylamino)methylideneamino]imidazole-4-carboxamide isomerase [Chloroflexota bacterium]